MRTRNKEINILGIPVLKVEKTENTRRQEYLCGLVKTYKFHDDNTIEKNITVLNMEIHRYNLIDDCIKSFIFGKKYKEIKLNERFYNKNKKILKGHDSVYVLLANIGESVVFLKLAKAYFKKNNSQTPIIIGTQDYHKELVEMLCPDIPVKIIKNTKLPLNRPEFRVKNCLIKLAFPKFYYDNVENNLRDKSAQQKHFTAHILTYLGLSESDFSKDEIKTTEKEKQVLLKKVKRIGLNVDNFVFLSPEANTCEELDIAFWEKLKKEMKDIDIFCNVTRNLEKYKNFKRCKLSLKEVYILAQLSKEIIGIRSGLMDLLADIEKPMKIIYTAKRKREGFFPLTAEEMLAGFTLNTCHNIKEILADNERAMHEII